MRAQHILIRFMNKTIGTSKKTTIASTAGGYKSSGSQCFGCVAGGVLRMYGWSG